MAHFNHDELNPEKITYEGFKNYDHIILIDGQRYYEWNKKLVDLLFSDINKDIKIGLPTFLDRITTNLHDGNLEIIDGQQRIITLNLFAVSLLKIIEERKLANENQHISDIKTFLRCVIYSNTETKDLRLVLRGKDNDSYIKIVTDKPTEGDNNIMKLYRYILAELKKIENSEDILKMAKQIQHVKFFMLQGINMSSGSCRELFQRTNSRTKPFSNVEQMKLNLLNTTDANSHDAFLRGWTKMEEVFDYDNKRIMKYIEAASRDSLYYLRNMISPEEVLNIKDKKKINQFLATLFEYPSKYKKYVENMENIEIELFSSGSEDNNIFGFYSKIFRILNNVSMNDNLFVLIKRFFVYNDKNEVGFKDSNEKNRFMKLFILSSEYILYLHLLYKGSQPADKYRELYKNIQKCGECLDNEGYHDLSVKYFISAMSDYSKSNLLDGIKDKVFYKKKNLVKITIALHETAMTKNFLKGVEVLNRDNKKNNIDHICSKQSCKKNCISDNICNCIGNLRQYTSYKNKSDKDRAKTIEEIKFNPLNYTSKYFDNEDYIKERRDKIASEIIEYSKLYDNLIKK